MNVKDILARKGDDVITIEPAATLATAMETLARRRIGALLLTGADRRIVGIISERDIVRVLVERGIEMLQSSVSEIMTRKVVSCGQNETIAEIMGRMTAGKFRHVPVVEQGRLIGIVSIGDVVKARLEELEREQDALRDPRILMFLAAWFGINVLVGSGLVSVTGGEQSIAWQAHIGGFVAGLILFALFDPMPPHSESKPTEHA